MPKHFGCFLSVGLGLFLSAAEARPSADDQVVKDPKGRVISKLTTNADKSAHRSSFQYGSDSAQPLVVVDEDLDPMGHATKRVVQRFDSRGRIQEKLDLQIDAGEGQTGTRTRYTYDPSGQRFEQVTPVKSIAR